MTTRLFLPLLIAIGLAGCASHPAAPAYEAVIPSCHGDHVRVCETFGAARDMRQCACVTQVLVFVD